MHQYRMTNERRPGLHPHGTSLRAGRRRRPVMSRPATAGTQGGQRISPGRRFDRPAFRSKPLSVMENARIGIEPAMR